MAGALKTQLTHFAEFKPRSVSPARPPPSRRNKTVCTSTQDVEDALDGLDAVMVAQNDVSPHPSLASEDLATTAEEEGVRRKADPPEVD